VETLTLLGRIGKVEALTWDYMIDVPAIHSTPIVLPAHTWFELTLKVAFHLFDGAAQELRDRSDLLGAVALQGAIEPTTQVRKDP
jgi:hypothetical protein